MHLEQALATDQSVVSAVAPFRIPRPSALLAETKAQEAKQKSETDQCIPIQHLGSIDLSVSPHCWLHFATGNEKYLQHISDM